MLFLLAYANIMWHIFFNVLYLKNKVFVEPCYLLHVPFYLLTLPLPSTLILNVYNVSPLMLSLSKSAPTASNSFMNFFSRFPPPSTPRTVHSHMKVTNDAFLGQSVPLALCRIRNFRECLYIISAIFTCFSDLNIVHYFSRNFRKSCKSWTHKNSHSWSHRLINT